MLITLTWNSAAQSATKLTKEGNKQYNSGKYNEAEISYRKSLAKEKNNTAAGFNLGNSLFKQQKPSESANQYNQVLSQPNLSDDQKSALYHNLGTSYLKDKKYEESINAFKQSLKLNPKDNDTRYNLAYAQSMLRQQQQQSKNDKNQDKKDKQQQDQQQNGQQQKDKDKQQQDQNKDSAQQQKEEKGKEDKGKQQKGSKQEISKEDAEKILQALNNDEKNLQKKMIQKEGNRIPIDKNW
jgi:tetratricopeptide (TPR) repeat protein